MPTRRGHAGLVGLAVGIIGGVIAAILLAPKRREQTDESTDGALVAASAGSRVLEALISSALDLLEASVEGYERVLERIAAATESTGMMPDERVTARIHDELEARGIRSSRLDVTTVDGVVYLRGREPDGARIDTIVGIAEQVPGVTSVVDEIKRE